MNENNQKKLQEAIKEVLAKIQRFQNRAIGEQNTKASLIEPILEALGWDVRDPDEVYREYKPTSKDSPVDYALTFLRKPRLFVEAKGLGENLSDRKWITQVLTYTTAAGVEWCILSDGDEYRFYNASAPLDAEEKLFCRVRLSAEPVEVAARTLSLIARSNMEGNILDLLWNAHFVDRRVKQVLESMFSSHDKSLIRLIRNRESKLTPGEITESLRRLDFQIHSSTPTPDNADDVRPMKRRPNSKIAKSGKRFTQIRGRSKAHFGVNLSDIIRSGIITPPLKLFRRYKGQVLESVLHPDGSVEFRGHRYPSCSTAAEIARSTITGRRMNTNGWDFWQYLDGSGKKTTLFEARQRYLSQNNGPSG